MYGVVRTSLQQRLRLTGLTLRTAFLYGMIYLICRRRVNLGLEGNKKCSAFPVEDGERRRGPPGSSSERLTGLVGKMSHKQ